MKSQSFLLAWLLACWLLAGCLLAACRLLAFCNNMNNVLNKLKGGSSHSVSTHFCATSMMLRALDGTPLLLL